ncbi:hypothetical protein Tcan_10578 [Toxocara canis]|uniref:Uncharacterized protein n=1 Tax=Toxocara canis TaxID=6265 RepID=A0A0B2UUM2_TOXCA|nr:hypothetical protein Tcan_10578 [Toxocara canis]
MDGGDMLEERKYMVLSEKTIEKLIIIEKIVGGDRARKAIARWITILSNRISAMDGGDMLEERKYMVLSEKTIEKLIIIEKIVGGDRARKAIARWITLNKARERRQRDLM